MAVAKKKTARGRKQDYEVRYESKKTGKSAEVKKAVKKVEKRFGR